MIVIEVASVVKGLIKPTSVRQCRELSLAPQFANQMALSNLKFETLSHSHFVSTRNQLVVESAEDVEVPSRRRRYGEHCCSGRIRGVVSSK